MTSSTGGLTCNTFLCTSVTEEAVSVVVDNLKAWFVEFCSSVGLSNGKTNGICEALSKRTSSDLNAVSIMTFGMTRRDAIQLLLRLLDNEN